MKITPLCKKKDFPTNPSGKTVDQMVAHFMIDSDGNFKEEMAMNERLSPHIKKWTDRFCRHKDILYLADHYGSKILKFIEQNRQFTFLFVSNLKLIKINE